jgi:hypothetical protein
MEVYSMSAYTALRDDVSFLQFNGFFYIFRLNEYA